MRKDAGETTGWNKECRRLVFTDNGFIQGVCPQMAYNKEEAVTTARKDLAQRLGVSDGEIREESVDNSDFPDMALGAATSGEMSGQMITPGWRICLQANNQSFEYRANKQQLRLYNYNGKNYRL